MKILNQSQAEAVYSAMCALNNVGGICGDLSLSEGLRVQWLESVIVRDGLSGPREEYPNQAEFAAAYGLDGEMVEFLGLSFKVLAKFPEADSGAANAYMTANPNAGLLCIEGGMAYLVDMSDEGVVA